MILVPREKGFNVHQRRNSGEDKRGETLRIMNMSYKNTERCVFRFFFFHLLVSDSEICAEVFKNPQGYR